MDQAREPERFPGNERRAIVLTHRFVLSRYIYRSESIAEAGCSGQRSVCIGEENIECEISIDPDKLGRLLSRKLLMGKNRSQLAGGAVVAKVVKTRDRRIHEPKPLEVV
jgi:hypothetical protein